MKLTIWLEIHLKLATDHKLYCGCTNSQDFDHDTPNNYVCPICTAQPGALPVINQESIQQSLRLGHALACQLNPSPRWDRKSYFYPDSPAGYQITQLYHPINTDGQMSFWDQTYTNLTTVGITQAHLENDTAKTIHVDGTAYIDYNRSGTPLVEVVTAPDFHSADEVTDFLKELQRIVKWNNIAYADLEKGQMRVDVNLSVSDTDQLGTRVEIKNMNSFAAIRRAIDYQYHQQVELLAQNKVVEQMTVWRDDAKGQTYVMRSKADSMDYRYFPEPDLPMLDVSGTIANVQKEVMIIPSQKIQEMVNAWFHKEYINALINDDTILHYYNQVINQTIQPSLAAKWMTWLMMWEIQTYGIDQLKFSQSDFVEFCRLIERGKLSDHHAKMIIEHMIQTWKSPQALISELGLDQQSEINLDTIIAQAIEANPKVLEDYRGGKPSAAWFFIGQVMKATAGKADPQDVKKAVNEYLERIS